MGKLTIKGYQIGPQIDQTGLKTFYRATNLATREEVWITVVNVRAGRSQQLLLRRAEQSQKLTLPILITALDFGVLPDEKVWFSHTPIPSVPLSQALRVIPQEEDRRFAMLRYMIQALEALDYIHSARATHRDLTTAQLRVDGKDRVLLEGYINARPKVEGRNIINIVHLPYIAPEQLRGAAADRRTDLYSMGTILYELTTGVLPYESNYAKIEDARQGVVPIPTRITPDLPLDLENIIMKSLAPRNSRYRTAQEMITDIRSFLRGRSTWKKLKEFSQLLKNLLPIRS